MRIFLLWLTVIFALSPVILGLILSYYQLDTFVLRVM